MKRLIAVLLASMFFAATACAQTINNLGAGRGSVVGTDLFPSYQGANPAVRPSAAQIGAYVYGVMSGDATANGTGTVTFATVNSNVGSFGSATQCVAHTVNAKGLVTATSQVTCTPAIGSLTGAGTGVITALGVNVGIAGSVVVNGGALGTPSSGVATNLTGTAAGLTAGNVTTNANLTGMVTSVGNAASLGSFTSANLATALSDETGSGASVFGTAPTIASLNATTAMTLAFITGSTQCLHVNSAGAISGTGSDCGSGGGGGTPGGSTTQVQYNNAGVFAGISGATTDGTTLSLAAPVLGTPASATLTNATGLPIASGVSGLGTGVATFLATPSSANLRAALTDEAGTGAAYFVGGALGTPASATLTNATGLPIAGITGLGTGVGTALAVNVGSAGAPVVLNGAGGTPSAITLTNGTGLPISTGVSGLATGAATFLGTSSSANLASLLTDETGSGANVFGTAPTISSPTINTAATFGFITGSTQCLHVNSSGALSGTGSDCGAASGVSSVTPGAGQVSSVTAAYSQTAVTSTGTISAAETVNAQTGTSYAIVDGDRAKLVTGTNAAAQAYTIAQAGASSSFVTGWYADVLNKGAGAMTITPTTSTINGAATYKLFAGQGVRIYSDGTNYQATPWGAGGVVASTQTGANYAFASSDFGKVVYLSNASNQAPTLTAASNAGFSAGWYVQACNIGAGAQTVTPTTSTIGGSSTYTIRAGTASGPVCITILSDGTNYLIVPEAPAMGSNVPTALATALSAAGGLTSTIASGSSAMGTSAISSGVCATVVTTAANVATTDVVSFGFNGDPTAVTGYAPVTTGGLAIYPYPTSGNVNFKVCNPTSSSITPGALTLNWRVTR